MALFQVQSPECVPDTKSSGHLPVQVPPALEHLPLPVLSEETRAGLPPLEMAAVALQSTSVDSIPQSTLVWSTLQCLSGPQPPECIPGSKSSESKYSELKSFLTEGRELGLIGKEQLLLVYSLGLL